MGALTKNKDVPRKAGELESYPVEDNVRIYKGAQVCVNEAGYAVPAADTIGYRLAGVAYEGCDNTLPGHTQGGNSVRVYRSGTFKLVATSITQGMVGQMLYVVDDQTVDDVSVVNFIPAGILVEFESGVSGWVNIDKALVREASPKSDKTVLVTKTDNYTVIVEDSGKVFGIATDAKVFTLPPTAKGLIYRFVNTGADGAVLVKISPVAADKVEGGGLGAGVANKALLNTKSTAKKYDMAEIVGDGVAGWVVTHLIGVWAKEA